jgi:alpha-methylacyl-CoA racemase
MGPLKGIKVLEFSGIGPGPYCGMLLADLGADVIRVSRPNTKGIKNKYDIHNRSKKSIVADLKNKDTIKELLKLIKQVDVVFEGYRPGIMEKLGIGPDVCLKHNPKIIYGRMTGWGQEGPLSKDAGHDINYISLSGALHSIGNKNSKPTIPLNLVADYGGGGMHLALGIVSGLINSIKTGKGQVIDAAMIDGSLSLMTLFFSLKEMNHWKDERESNLLDGYAPFYDTYECSDGKFISIGSLEPKFFEELITKLNINTIQPSDQYKVEQWPFFKEEIRSKIIQKTRDEWSDIFKDSDACVSPVLSLKEAPECKHNIARESFIDIDGFNQPAPSPRFSDSKLEIKHNAVETGSDIDSVCKEFNLSKDFFS